MKRLLYILLLVISWNTLTAQTYQVNNQKIRFMNALGIPAKDTAAANWANAADTSIILIRPGDSTLWYRYKGNFRKVGTGGGTAIVDTVNTIASKGRLYKVADSLGAIVGTKLSISDSATFSTKSWRQKGDDSVSALISPRITDSLRSLVRLRASGSGGIQLQNSNGTNVADFGTANTTNGSIAGGWNVGGNLAVTGTSGFTGKATFTDSIVGVNQRLTGNALFSGSANFNNTSTYQALLQRSSLNGVFLGFENVGQDFYSIGMPSGSSDLIFRSSGTTERVRFLSDGKVGIGTSTPSQLLDVAGLARFNSGGNWMEFSTNVLTSLNSSGAHIRSVISTSSNPTYSWVGNTNTGFYNPSTNEIGVSANGSEVSKFTASGLSVTGTLSTSGALTATAQGNNITVGVDSSVTSTSYTLVLGDAGYLKRCSNASAITITVPTNASVAFPIGTTIYFSQQGAGKVSVSPATSDVTIQSEGSLLGTAGQHAVIGLIKVNTNRWLLVGNRG